MTYCDSCKCEWNDSKYHAGTCGNCGAPARGNKKESHRSIPVISNDRILPDIKTPPITETKNPVKIKLR